MSNNEERFDFAAWTKLLPPSEIRALLEYKVKYNFGGGLPGALPVETLADILIEIGNENKADYQAGKIGKAISLWNYGPTGGQEFVLRVLAERLRRIDDINLDKETGWKALRYQLSLIFSNQSQYYQPTMSILHFVQTWASTSSLLEQTNYAQFIADSFGCLVDTPLNQLK